MSKGLIELVRFAIVITAVYCFGFWFITFNFCTLVIANPLNE